MENFKNNRDKSILLQVDEATKGIMREIESGITDDIISTINQQKKIMKELKEQTEEVYKLERENNKLLKDLLRKIEYVEEHMGELYENEWNY